MTARGGRPARRAKESESIASRSYLKRSIPTSQLLYNVMSEASSRLGSQPKARKLGSSIDQQRGTIREHLRTKYRFGKSLVMSPFSSEQGIALNNLHMEAVPPFPMLPSDGHEFLERENLSPSSNCTVVLKQQVMSPVGLGETRYSSFDYSQQQFIHSSLLPLQQQNYPDGSLTAYNWVDQAAVAAQQEQSGQ